MRTVNNKVQRGLNFGLSFLTIIIIMGIGGACENGGLSVKQYINQVLITSIISYVIWTTLSKTNIYITKYILKNS